MSDPPADHAGLEVLAHDECLRLLGEAPVGRIAFLHDGDPVILPVNHVLHGDSVAFRTAYGSKLEPVVESRSVAYEVDGYDPQHRQGWSVLVSGPAEEVLHAAELGRLNALGLHPWASTVERDIWIRIRPESITGRRIVPRASGE